MSDTMNIETIYRLFDNNTGEEVFASANFKFADPPLPNHRIHDEDLVERYGAPALVDRVEAGSVSDDNRLEIKVFIDADEERLNGQDIDTSYRRS
jgi:hypothetical protein